MIAIVCCILGLVVAVAVWVEGIDYMNTNHPDYKGEDLFNEEQENEK